MVLHPLFGHREARSRLAAAFRSRRLPQVLLVTGPVGIGKQRFALWLAQLLLCEAPTEEPCGRCRACRRVLDLGHPDLHWFIPIARPKAGEPDRQVEEAAELLAEALSARRERPFSEPGDGMGFHPIASVRLLLRRAGLTPVEGARKVFVVGEADRLVPQESNPEAANALLKFLEEPPLDTWVVLTTTEAERVLPTIRSRVVPVRLSRLPDVEVRAFVEAVIRPAGEEAIAALVRLADGAVGGLAGDGEAGSERGSRAVTEARAFLASIEHGPGGRLERALRQLPWSARGGFTELLDAVARELSEQARTAASRDRVESVAEALHRVATAREEAQRNVNPQLLLADLANELAEVL